MKKTKLIRILLLVLLLVLASALPGCSSGKKFQKLHVEGTQLVNEKNEPVQLKGISTHGLAWFPQYVNKECFHQLKTEWGCDIIRLAMYTQENMGYMHSNGDQEALKTLIDTGVKLCTEEGMYALIDWHILSDGDPNRYKDEACAFFDEMSAKYKDYDNVLYEICNEPNNVQWDAIKAYAEEVIPVIRKNDPDAIVIVGTPSWSKLVMAPTYDMLDYDNVMYTLHFYADTHRASLRKDAKDAMAKGLPIFVTEYGISDSSGKGAANTEEGDLWAEFLDEYKISSCCWNLSNKDETCALIKPECVKTSGFTDDDLTDSGAWLKKYLQKQ
ncbi:MAG: glycoside hydrolase family 5 protein [Lachnospiraceae bacterium]|nr:glycoside hydrolase family 5 protein [Lachnospiraceae bacterium]